MADRSRRDKKSSKLEQLAALKRAREGGGRTWKDENDDTLYDEVTEDQYKSIVKGRLQKDDFVVDDGVEGYMDNGMDDWSGDDREAHNESESEDERRRKKSNKKSKDSGSKSKTKAKAPPPAPAPSISAYRPIVAEDKEDDFMAGLLGTMDNVPTAPSASRKARKRKPSPAYNDEDRSSPPPSRFATYRNRNGYADMSSDGPTGATGEDTSPSSDDFPMSPKKKTKYAGVVTPAVDRISHLNVQSDPEEMDSSFDTSFNDVDMGSFMQVDDDDDLGGVKPHPQDSIKKETREEVLDTQKRLKGITDSSIKAEMKNSKAWLSVYETLNVAAEDSLGPLSSASASVHSSNISALEPDGSMRFFWLDYLELDGKLYFVGKLKDKTSGAWVSSCVTVEGLQRNLFVLPRPKRCEEDDEGGLYETDDVPEQEDVEADFERVRRHFGIKSVRSKWVKRKYAFGESDVPRDETSWLKVTYGFNEPVIPSTAQAPNFSHVFGTSTSAFELLVLKRKIMGPCWLQIKNPHIEHKGVSWCKLEATVTDPKDINPFLETDADAPREIPPLTVMSLSIRTIVNHRENKREIVCATARTWSNLQLDDPTPPEKLPCSVHTFVRHLDRFPHNFETRARESSRGSMMPAKNERMLLNSLLLNIHKADPDIIVGHEFLGVSLDVLLHRMKELKADHWSRIGRFRRNKWPNVGRQGTNLKFLNGRMLCDLTSDAAKGMIASTTWSMTEMCSTHLKSERQDIDPDDTASYLDGSMSTPDRMLTFVKHCELDAHFQMAIAAKVQILPLTRQLTNLAGNSWNKTLNGGRAERNEYILLHEFHRLKYICPDKTWGKKAAAAAKEDDDAEGGKTTTKGKRDKYKGGLVFEPKRGLWDKFILVMDFNSLYPSIIQEYNIDFTTIAAADEEENGEDKIPEPPSRDTAQGVLPRLIATLVNRRRQVKALMKDKTASHAKLLQYDIKQQALKLTANSMYGCLGFEYSRFYARPLAALTTFKGREILTHTRELAESLQLDVVYGDTDSVFVNSNVTELADALKISATFKKAVNDQYKLLEIDLDGVFKRLLLLQKKKYAALKVEDGARTSTEIKGLDMKRREYCALSKNVSQYVLDQILSGEATETVVENIHEYLHTIGSNIREGKIKLDEFIIFKRLGKNPEDYPDAKSQPHVQVALRMKTRGGSARSGDVIPYVFCMAEGEESAKSAQADRAKHPDEVRKAGSGLKIDYEHYLAHQVLPPIERLCEPIEGTDRARLAECLGLDPGRFKSSNASADALEVAFAALDSQLSDKERYKDVTPFTVRCTASECGKEVTWGPLGDRSSCPLGTEGALCPSCHAVFPISSLIYQLERAIRVCIGTYYAMWTVCNEPTCGARTRGMQAYGRRCGRIGCTGSVALEYTDAELYTQLRYFAWLFDRQAAERGATTDTVKSSILTVAIRNNDVLSALGAVAERYLADNARRWVDMGSIFSFVH